MNKIKTSFLTALYLVVLIGFLSVKGDAFEKLPEAYLVSYGDPHAKIQITHFFSFTCPNCVALYREEFSDLKRDYVDSGKVHLTFHPVPMDLLTVQGMHCLEKLSPKEKKIFLEALLEELIIDNPEFSTRLMIKAMDLLDKPTPLLQDRKYLEETAAFTDAFKFLKQEEKIVAVPTVEVNGTIYAKEVPDKHFIEAIIKKSGETK